MTDNIVNTNNYIKFIKNNKYLTECQKNNLILLKNKLNKNYVNRKSNIQISTYIKDSIDNINNIAKIILLFNNFFSKKKTDLIIEKIKNNELIYDSEIINYIKSTKINLPNIIVKNNNKCSYWKYIFENLELKYHDIKNINSENSKKFDDIIKVKMSLSDDDDDDKFKSSKKPTENKSRTPVLDTFGKDLTRIAEEGKIDPIIGRDKEIERVSQILGRRKKNEIIKPLKVRLS
jgi:ATP-dependent Clp protease ATP-binding subunit ClpC